MTQSVARVPSSWWCDARFLKLDPNAQRVLFLLWTQPETPICGIVSLAGIAERLRLRPGVVRSRLVELQDAGFIKLDPDAAQLWLLRHIETRLGGMPTDCYPWTMNTCGALDGLVQTEMVKAFRTAYKLPSVTPKRQKKEAEKRGPSRGPSRGPDRGSRRGAPFLSVLEAGAAGVVLLETPVPIPDANRSCRQSSSARKTGGQRA